MEHPTPVLGTVNVMNALFFGAIGGFLAGLLAIRWGSDLCAGDLAYIPAFHESCTGHIARGCLCRCNSRNNSARNAGSYRLVDRSFTIRSCYPGFFPSVQNLRFGYGIEP